MKQTWPDGKGGEKKHLYRVIEEQNRDNGQFSHKSHMAVELMPRRAQAG